MHESAAEEKHIDFAVRYSHSIGDWDIGLAHFYGTSREPRLLSQQDLSGNPILIPFYDIIHQTSADVQLTDGNMAWKLEALHRSGRRDAYNAMVAGFEYTFVEVMGGVVDVVALAEYRYDGRGKSALTIFQDDVAVGVRLSFNDVQSSQALMGLV